ncbi:MAG: hypothetical protein HQL84_14235 [Magnetococcales bacterium]|nr:hypothetical protein [Magnetococcales bacterium]MBF0151193.1 hypothetical protein [Magnetococcales bacterium]MBF0174435.1 hypothetical protein [Magnetococcales bacterium]MBF0632390.1 hypothetical protein [Magnetococcales bacterium]
MNYANASVLVGMIWLMFWTYPLLIEDAFKMDGNAKIFGIGWKNANV